MGISLGLGLLGISGILISLYFTLVYYHLMPPDYRLVPPVCRMEDSTCQVVLFTRYGSLFGAPNSLYGTIYYVLVIAAAFYPDVRKLLLVLSVIVVAISIFLAYVLIVRLKTPCILCFTSHVINIFITVLLLLG